MPITFERAAALAMDGLLFLAAEPSRIGGFATSGGLDIGGDPSAALAEIRRRADDAAFLGSALDYIAADEGLAEAFCREAGLTPEEFRATRAALPGGDAPDWT